ncbi:MAG: polysaccharide deacetylase family protein [Cellulosilyticaceae bacterium]
MRHKKKSEIGMTILFFALAIIFLSTTGFLVVKNSHKSEALSKVKQKVEVLANKKDGLETQVKELETKNSEKTKEIDSLKQEVEQMKTKYPNVSVDGENQRYAYLTFDDGPSKNTVKILDFLKANNIKATFFVLGKEGHGDIYNRIVKEGHTIAIHSNTHEYSQIYTSVDSFMKDITDLSALIEKETGVKPNVLRFPGGSNNTVSHRYGGSEIMNQIIPTVEKAGYTYFDWNVDSMDASKGLQDKNVIVNSVLSGAGYTDNAVILMHDAAAKTTTVEALPEIVEGLRKDGFMFRTLTPNSEPVKFK